MRALVVDDSLAIRSFLRMMLNEFGFEVFEAKHGKAAIEVLAKTGPLDLALVDWNMPEMGGLELVRQVRADERFEAMRLVMVTTETDMQEVQTALACGVDEYVMKPFNKEIIADKLHLVGF